MVSITWLPIFEGRLVGWPMEGKSRPWPYLQHGLTSVLGFDAALWWRRNCFYLLADSLSLMKAEAPSQANLGCGRSDMTLRCVLYSLRHYLFPITAYLTYCFGGDQYTVISVIAFTQPLERIKLTVCVARWLSMMESVSTILFHIGLAGHISGMRSNRLGVMAEPL